jgi:hypothetical protein
MQLISEVNWVSEDNEEYVKLSQKQKFIIEVIFMIIVGGLVILPLALYAYHFLI